MKLNKEQLEKAKELFDQAVNLNPVERDKYLNEKCGTESDLKNEVLDLIKSLESTNDFLEDPLTVSENELESFKDPIIGKQIGNYLIEGETGVGGMGIVYSGTRNDDEFKQKAAIKILKRGLTTEYLLKRFQIERQTLANLQHENIARLLDGGRTDDGLPYLVMEFIKGISITEYCNQKNLSIKERLKLFRKVCSAVQHAHQNLIIHRDIKPGNILVTEEGEPKLLDFGIAKLLNEDFAESTEGLTRTGVWHLTPEYSSPEQIKGEKITTASDIYSLGVLLYELLTGDQPYRITSSSPSVINKIITEENVLKPSDKVKQTTEDKTKAEGNLIDLSNPEKISHQLKGDLDNIVLKAMHKDPIRRYNSVEQFSEDIKKYLLGFPVIAQKDTTGYRISKFIQRHKVGFVSSVIFFLFLVASAVAIIWQANLTAEERDKVKIEAQKVEEVNSFLQQMLSSVDPTEIGRDVKVYDILEKAAADIETSLKNQPEIEAGIRSTLGNTYVNLGEYDKAKPFLDEALRINESIYGKDSKEIAYSLHDMGLYYDWVGDYKKADSLYNKSISILRTELKQPTKRFSNLLNDHALIKMYYGEYETAEKIFEEALEVAVATHGEKDRNTAVIMNNRALNYSDAGNLEEAEKYYKKAMAILIELLGENRPEIGSSYNNLAYLYMIKKEYDLAEEYLYKSYELKLNLLGEDHPDVGLALNNLGVINIRNEDYSAAEDYMIKAIEQYIKTHDADHPLVALSQYWLGKVYLETKRLDEAESYLRKSLKTRIKKFPAENKDIWRSKTELGICLLEQKKYSEAETLLNSTLEFYKNNFSDDIKQIKRLYDFTINLYNETGKEKIAEKYSEEFSDFSKKTTSN